MRRLYFEKNSSVIENILKYIKEELLRGDKLRLN